MAIKAETAIDLSLSLFGGKDSSLKATDLPEGLSPDNQDVIYGPGFVASRPCASKLFAAPFAGNPRVLSEHGFLQANQQPLNLFLDSLGVLHKEDVTNSPGTHSIVGNVTANAIMKAVTLDGFDYQVFSDGVHGIDIPRIYDGVNWDRLSQEGPAIAPTAADLNSVIAITSITAPAAVNITRISQSGLVNTIITAAAHLLTVGDAVNIAVAAGNAFNGSYFVTGTPSATEFTVAAQNISAAAFALGSIQSNMVTVVTAAPHGLQVTGDVVAIVGSASNNYNNGNLSTDAVGGTVQNQPTWNVSTITNATTFIMVVNVGVPGATANGNAQIGGLITSGTHQVCQAFLTRSGYISKPSPPVTWQCGGQKQTTISALAIGPANVVARILFFTGAFGGNFFWIPVNVIGGAMATVVADNTSLTATVDFSDNTLFASDGIDIPGNNLFNLVTLAPCLGIDAYASRVFTWGEFNKVQNFLNMGFEGGTATVGGVVPLGWNVAVAGGTLVAAPNGFGLAWQMSGNGTNNLRAALNQSAYQNFLNQFILDPNTQYTFWCWAKPSAPALAGNVVVTIQSASTGFVATATIPFANFPAGGAFLSGAFSLPMPAVIPADMIIQVGQIGMAAGPTVTIDEMMMVFTEQPYRDTVMRGSYVNNAQSFDGVTGDIGPAGDPNPIRDTYQLLEQLGILTSERRHVTRDNQGEPGTWEVDQVETKCGAASVMSTTTGPNWVMWIADTGKSLSVRITSGGESFKISREMKADFESVVMSQKQKAWILNVDDESRVYVGLPLGEKNITAVLDYFESDTAQDIAFNRPLKIGFTGKMLTTDLGRKWTIWNIPMPCGAVLARPGGLKQFVGGSGVSLAKGPFGNAYIFDPTKLTDDDYGQMFPYYTTYFFINHEQELQLPVGSKNKYYSALTTFITGVGALQITPLVNTLTNPIKNVIDPAKPWVLTQTLADDTEWSGLDVKARRCAFKISVTPFDPAAIAPPTDVQFVLSHLGITIQKHPVSPQAGVNRGSP